MFVCRSRWRLFAWCKRYSQTKRRRFLFIHRKTIISNPSTPSDRPTIRPKSIWGLSSSTQPAVLMIQFHRSDYLLTFNQLHARKQAVAKQILKNVFTFTFDFSRYAFFFLFFFEMHTLRNSLVVLWAIYGHLYFFG